METTGPPSSRVRGPVRALLGAILGLAALGGAVEASFRLVGSADPQFHRFLFQSRLNLARWSFLTAHRDRLGLGLATRLQPGLDAVLEPERDRPAFDRIAVAYRVATNAEGFRESPFAWAVDRRTWFALGDSVTFGRGVERTDRFADLLQGALPRGTKILNFGVPGCTSTCLADVLARYARRRPSLVILQATGNDLDITRWRLSREGRSAGLRVLALKAVVFSRVLAWAANKFSGDPRRRGAGVALAAAEAYRSDLERIARTLKDLHIPLVVFEVPDATGSRVAGHITDFFKTRPEVCLGVLEVSFDRPQNWIADWERRAGGQPARPDWVTLTAGELGLDESRLAPYFPNRVFFQDIIHPNALGNELIAAQLRSFLETLRPSWFAHR